MDAPPTDAELAEWLQWSNVSDGRLTMVEIDWRRTVRALQAARERIAELEAELAWRLGPWRNED